MLGTIVGVAIIIAVAVAALYGIYRIIVAARGGPSVELRNINPPTDTKR